MRASQVLTILFHVSLVSVLTANSSAFSSKRIALNGPKRERPTRQLTSRQSKGSDSGRPLGVLNDGSGDILGSGGFNLPVFKKLRGFTDRNFFLVGLFVAVLTAKFFPSIGVDGGILRPELFIGKYGVGLIFLLSGLSLQTSELAKAVSNTKLNGLIQLSTFVLWPFLIGLPLRAFLTSSVMPNLIPSALADGILILTCLPTTVNMCIMLTSSVSVFMCGWRRH
jgi:SBF-like CPA transporter family (DUF4137)